jgi:hypothetical protein
MTQIRYRYRSFVQFLFNCTFFFVFFCLCTQATAEDKDKEPLQSTFVKLIHSNLPRSTTALCWHLDDSGYAVKTERNFLIFDYSNDQPIKYHGKGKLLPRSLLTGVIEPSELAGESVVVFYSHLHPAEKTLMIAIGWRKIIPNIRYVLAEEVFNKFKDELQQIQAQEISQNSLGASSRDLMGQIQNIPAGGSLYLNGMRINTFNSDYMLDADKQERYPGVEFIVDCDGGFRIYHSGSFLCRQCLAREPSGQFKSMLSTQQPQKVLSANTKTLTFSDGEIVAIDNQRFAAQDRQAPKMHRLGLAIFGSEPVPKLPVIMFEGPYSTWDEYLKLSPPGNFEGFSITGFFFSGGKSVAEPLPMPGPKRELFLQQHQFFPEQFKKSIGLMSGNQAVIQDILGKALTLYAQDLLNPPDDLCSALTSTISVTFNNQRARGECISLSKCAPMSYYGGYDEDSGIGSPFFPDRYHDVGMELFNQSYY